MTFALFLAPALAALLAYVLAPFAGRLALYVGAVDQPGPRKIHQRPIPRLGGVAVMAAIAIVAALTFYCVPTVRSALSMRMFAGIALGLLPIMGVSIFDDIKPLPSTPKFLAHLAGAALAVACGVCLRPEVHLFGQTITIGWFAAPLSMLWLVGTTNAFNIVDGLDGLSAGLALISASALAGIFMLADQPAMAGAALVLAGGLVGFLPHNMFPARMFFGDTGATAIGFCLAAFALRGGSTLSAGFATLLPIFVLGLPIAETMISMARRIVRRLESKDASGVFEADGNHMHHRLLKLGVNHPRAVFILYGAGVLLAGGALASMFMTARESALMIVALLLAGFLGVHRLGYDEFAIIRNGTALRVYEAPALNRSMFVVFVDVMIVVLAAIVAVALKTDVWNLSALRPAALAMVAILAPVTVIVFWRMNLYRGSWRLATIDDFGRACCAVFVATFIGMTVRTVLAPGQPSMSLFSIYALVAVIMVTGSRASYQMLVASRWRAAGTGAPTLIYGAGRKGATALRELTADVTAALRPVAFIDDDIQKEGRLLNGIPVVGALESIEFAIRRFAVRAVVVASDTVSDLRLAELGERCERLGVALLKLHITFSSADGVFAPASAIGALAVNGLSRTAPSEPVRPQTYPAPVAAPQLAAPKDAARHDSMMNVRFEEACVPGTRVPIVAGQRCPSCTSYTLFRSHVKKMTERLQKRLTHKRLYRCQDCGWRGWIQALDVSIYQTLPQAPLRSPALDPFDLALSRNSRSKRAS
jgi:UDP-GlcNAc:undecaprenyl-phosphate GlcNAc-1-phosphate transferase